MGIQGPAPGCRPAWVRPAMAIRARLSLCCALAQQMTVGSRAQHSAQRHGHGERQRHLRRASQPKRESARPTQGLEKHAQPATAASLARPSAPQLVGRSASLALRSATGVSATGRLRRTGGTAAAACAHNRSPCVHSAALASWPACCWRASRWRWAWRRLRRCCRRRRCSSCAARPATRVGFWTTGRARPGPCMVWSARCACRRCWTRRRPGWHLRSMLPRDKPPRHCRARQKGRTCSAARPFHHARRRSDHSALHVHAVQRGPIPRFACWHAVHPAVPADARSSFS